MTQIDTEPGTKEDDAIEGSPETVVSLELRPESHYVQTVIWFGYVIALFVGLAFMFSGLENSYLLFFLTFGAGSMVPWAFLTPTLPGRALRRLEVTPEEIRFLHGSVVKKSLLWGRVERIEWGALIWRRRKGALLGAEKERQWPYLRFVGFPLLASIRVTGIDFQVRREEVERVALAVAHLARSHSIPIEHRDAELNETAYW